MTYVIGPPCIDIKDASCVAECPVDCIYVGGRMLYIQARRVHRLRRLRAGLPRRGHLPRAVPARRLQAVHRGERRILPS